MLQSLFILDTKRFASHGIFCAIAPPNATLNLAFLENTLPDLTEYPFRFGLYFRNIFGKVVTLLKSLSPPMLQDTPRNGIISVSSVQALAPKPAYIRQTQFILLTVNSYNNSL
jgi:hypothetical protein